MKITKILQVVGFAGYLASLFLVCVLNCRKSEQSPSIYLELTSFIISGKFISYRILIILIITSMWERRRNKHLFEIEATWKKYIAYSEAIDSRSSRSMDHAASDPPSDAILCVFV